MDRREWLTKQFEDKRAHLRGVAYRMLGSLGDADDAVQETWLRLNRSDTSRVENLGGWLTTVVARVCLDTLRSRKSKREEPLSEFDSFPVADPQQAGDPENEVLLAESVGLALLVVLETLAPAERIAFVLHDIFAVPFEEIAPIVGRTPTAARQIASRARRRVQGSATVHAADLRGQREVVDAFIAALRTGDFNALVALLDPEIVVRGDGAVQPLQATSEGSIAENFARGAISAARGARYARPALVEGEVGVVVAPRGRLWRVLRFTIAQGKITGINMIGDPGELRKLSLAILND